MTSKEWKEYTVQELIDMKMLEEPLDGNHGNLHPKSSDYVASGVPFIMANNLEHNSISYDSCVFLSETQANMLKKGIARPGDVLITHKATIGRTAIVPDIYEKIILTPQVTYYRVKKGIYNKYLKYYFDTPKFQQIFNNWAGAGSTRAYLGITAQHKLPIVLPPLETQEKIAWVLSSLDDKIELNNKINQNLEQQAQAIFKSWFVDFEPFGGKMPEDWSLKILSDISNITAGGDKPDIVSNIETEECKIPIYSNGIDNNGLYGYTTEPKILQESVTVSARGTIGFTCLRLHPYVPIVRLISLIPRTDIVSAKYLYFSLLNKHITGTGTTQQQLTVPYFKTTPIIVPTFDIVNQFTEIVNSFYKIIEKNICENKRLIQLRDTLLPKLMSGEIDVDKI